MCYPGEPEMVGSWAGRRPPALCHAADTLEDGGCSSSTAQLGAASLEVAARIVVPALGLGSLPSAAGVAKTGSALRASDTDHSSQSEVTKSPCMMSSAERKHEESNSKDRDVF